MAKITAVIITLNEARNIARCIESLEEVADEVLVIDSNSKDNTTGIAEKLGAKVIQRDWQGYSATKNFGNEEAENDFILSIDADEALSEELKKSIISIKPSLRRDEAYTFNRLTNYCGHWIKHCGWYPDIKMRLWHRDTGQWQGNIHEEVDLLPYVKTTRLKGNLLHYSYRNISDHIKQADHFTTLTAKNDFDRGKRSNFAKLLFAPCVKFIKSYVFQLGFLDGVAGFYVCRISAFATFLKYSKLRELQKRP